MLYLRNAADIKAPLTPAEHLAFIKKCEVYIGQLKAAGSLIAAQPKSCRTNTITKSNLFLFNSN